MPTVGKFTDSSNATFLEAISKSITSDSNLDAHFVLPPFLSRRCSLTTQRHLSSAVKAFHHSNHTSAKSVHLTMQTIVVPTIAIYMTTCMKVMVDVVIGSFCSFALHFWKKLPIYICKRQYHQAMYPPGQLVRILILVLPFIAGKTSGKYLGLSGLQLHYLLWGGKR